MLQSSSGSKYWDIHDFLCEEEKVSTKFMTDSFENSQLDFNSPSEELTEIKSGQILEVPLWLAIKLCQGKFLQIEIPQFYRENFKKTLIADPIVVNLREKNIYYYETGVKLCQYIDDRKMGQVLMDVFLLYLDFSRESQILRQNQLSFEN